MIRLKLDNVSKNTKSKYGKFFEIQLLPQIGLVYWAPTKKDPRKIWGIYFVWVFWSILLSVDKKIKEQN